MSIVYVKYVDLVLFLTLYLYNHGRTGRKKLGGRKEICPTFSDCAGVVKKNFPEKLSKIVIDGGGGGGGGLRKIPIKA
jgi:hypothetical protein